LSSPNAASRMMAERVVMDSGGAANILSDCS
jgi:hypothetical protein